ncbi:hypothetical protein [Nocardia wallacei]|uniref:hypothetical protein n=1 Tax=Nocardia wallacei TaxID=480035 RepID=UPI002456031F|nr:hypothetical protein [Nocardia wallacei]
MTVITARITDIAGAADARKVVFYTIVPRENSDGTAIVGTKRHEYIPDDTGSITTGELDPGPAKVQIGVGTAGYAIEIPDSGTPVPLWPLIQAGLPIPPIEEATAVRNGGGVRRIQRITEAAYLELPIKDPETLYVVVED